MTKFKITRTDIINYLIEKYNLKTYLEIGVRNPNDNFNKIKCDNKVAVDPEPLIKTENIYVGTSDNYFQNISQNKKFDIIFIDGFSISTRLFEYKSHTTTSLFFDFKRLQANILQSTLFFSNFSKISNSLSFSL